jgi:hypothetical protein
MMMAYLILYYVIKPFAVNLLGVLLFSGLNFDGTKGTGSKGPAMPVNPANLDPNGAFTCDTCTKTFTRSVSIPAP